MGIAKMGLVLGLAMALGGCSALPARLGGLFGPRTEAGTQGTLPPPPSPPPVAQARSAAALDTTTPAERAAAQAPAAAGAALGRVVVSLGPPAEPGFWLRSALVTAPAPGLVRSASGAAVQVELRPGGGAAQLSLAAFRALGLPLTGLPAVEVFRQ